MKWFVMLFGLYYMQITYGWMICWLKSFIVLQPEFYTVPHVYSFFFRQKNKPKQNKNPC